METELRADRELLDTFGSLIELAGIGFVRPRLDAVLVDRLEIARQARFENGSLDVHIFAPGDRGLSLSCARVGITRWELSDDGLEVGVSSRCGGFSCDGPEELEAVDGDLAPAVESVPSTSSAIGPD